jgi:hypothetical protein
MNSDHPSPHLSADPAERQRTVRAQTWVASFAIATLVGLGFALQRWYAFNGPDKPPSFWDARVIPPQLIPWFAWGAIAPLLMIALDRLPWRAMPAWRRVALYAALALVAIVVQATLTGLALGWWWSFPNPIPRDPSWHIADQLRNRTTVSLLIVWLITAMYHASVRASRAPVAETTPLAAAPVGIAAPPAPPPAPAMPAPVQASPTGPMALRTADRIWFVDPRTIDWIEADGDYVVVHVGTASHRIRETISSIEQRVPADLLVRVSRSAIVNLSSVREMQRWFRGNFIVILRDGTRVTTGARYRDRLIRRI